MTFRSLTIQLTRAKKTRNLQAYVIQVGKHQVLRGANLLGHRKIRRIESAKTAVTTLLPPWMVTSIDFDVQAAPDLAPPYRGVSRTQARRELEA